MENKLTQFFDQLRKQPEVKAGDIRPFGEALTELVAGGGFCLSTGGGSGGCGGSGGDS